MLLSDAFLAFVRYKKLRRIDWGSDKYIAFRDGMIVDQDMNAFDLNANDLTNFFVVSDKEEEKSWLGKICFFSDLAGDKPTIGLLKAIEDRSGMRYKTDMGSYFNCRPLTENEIKQITYKE